MFALALILAAAPAAPTLTTPVTLGASKDGVVKVTGKNLESLHEAWLGTQKLAISKIDAKAETATFAVVIPKTFAVGLHGLRVVTSGGVSNVRPFVIDDLVEVPAEATRTKREAAQSLKGPCTVAGVATADLSDWYRYSVKKDERLTFEVVGRRLGSQIDPVIILHDAKSNRELPGLYADDTIGLQTDCRLTHTFKADADIIIEVRDTTYRGGTDFGYRLRVGDFASAILGHPLPVADGDDVVLNALQMPLVSPRRNGGLRGWGVPTHLDSHSETEPNDDFKNANTLSVPGSIAGRFQTKNDKDWFAMTLKKGAKVSLVAEAAEFNLPTEVLLKLFDKDGKEIAASDPSKLPAQIEFTPPADGTYYVQAEHLNYGWGGAEVYRIVAKPVVPDAAVTLSSDRVVAGGKLNIIGVTRLAGYEGAIDLKWDGDSAVAAAGTIAAKENPNATKPFALEFKAAKGAKPGVYVGRVVSVAKDRKPVTASTLDVLKQSFPHMTNPPPEMAGWVFVHVP